MKRAARPRREVEKQKRREDAKTRERGEHNRGGIYRRVPASPRLRVISAFCLLSFASTCGLADGRASAILPYGAAANVPVAQEARVWLLKQARARLGGKAVDASFAPAPAKAARPTTLFVTLYRRGQASPPFAGSGPTLSAALQAALETDALKSGFAPPNRIQIDVLDGEMVPVEKPSASEPWSRGSAFRLILPGSEGLAIEAGGRLFYLPPSQLIDGRIFADDTDEQPAEDLLDRAAAVCGVNDWRAAAVRLRRFRTVAFVEDAGRRTALDLDDRVSLTEIDRTRLGRAARAGGDYLIRAQKSDGSFHYEYDPVDESVSERDYNILRHAGAAIALFQLYEATREANYLKAARRAVGYLRNRFHWAREADAVYVLDDDGKAKLGANGLALVALAMQIRLDPKSADRASAGRLANLILRMQGRDGAFASYYGITGEPEDRVSLYYPGEAMLGLIELYRSTGDQRLVEAARRGADYLIESQKRMAALPPDAWLMQALAGLFAVRRDPPYVAHALNLAGAMIAAQYRVSDAPSYAGGYRPGVPGATPAAARAEGLLAALRLARATGDGRATRIAEALKLGARFQLTQQFGADNSYMIANPERAAGGFRESLTSTRIRIDYVQHNISALLGLAAMIGD